MKHTYWLNSRSDFKLIFSAWLVICRNIEIKIRTTLYISFHGIVKLYQYISISDLCLISFSSSSLYSTTLLSKVPLKNL